VRKKISQDPVTEKLASKHPLVVLHSRRYAGGGYLKSAFSFNYQTADETEHKNDVQLLFDNERVHQSNFQIHMVTNQHNEVIDLGTVDFDKDAEFKKLANQSKNPWSTYACKAVESHVYLEKVKDDNGNDYFVVFKIIALDSDSRYMAFLWYPLPGGKQIEE